MTLARSQLVMAQALLHEAHDDLTGALVLFNSDDRRRFSEYLHDCKRELEAAAKALGYRLVAVEQPSARAVEIVRALTDVGFERVEAAE